MLGLGASRLTKTLDANTCLYVCFYIYKNIVVDCEASIHTYAVGALPQNPV